MAGRKVGDLEGVGGEKNMVKINCMKFSKKKHKYKKHIKTAFSILVHKIKIFFS